MFVGVYELVITYYTYPDPASAGCVLSDSPIQHNPFIPKLSEHLRFERF